jgi:hypothetical protein
MAMVSIIVDLPAASGHTSRFYPDGPHVTGPGREQYGPVREVAIGALFVGVGLVGFFWCSALAVLGGRNAS